MDKVIKEDVIAWISENEGLLETLRRTKEADETKDWFDELSSEEKNQFDVEKNHEENNTLTSREFGKENAR